MSIILNPKMKAKRLTFEIHPQHLQYFRVSLCSGCPEKIYVAFPNPLGALKHPFACPFTKKPISKSR